MLHVRVLVHQLRFRFLPAIVANNPVEPDIVTVSQRVLVVVACCTVDDHTLNRWSTMSFVFEEPFARSFRCEVTNTGLLLQCWIQCYRRPRNTG